MKLLFKYPYLPITAGLILRTLHLKSAAASPLLNTLIIDSNFYHQQALAISQGDILGHHHFFMSPLYPYLMALIYTLTYPSPLLIAFLQILLSCFTLYLLWKITLLFTENHSAASLAACCGAIYPVWIYFDSALLTASILLFLYTAVLWLLFKFAHRGKTIHLALAGVCLGLSALARPSSLIFTAALALWTLFKYDIRKTLIIILFTFIIILPFSLRNLIVTGEKTLITVSSGMNFFVGNNPQATGLYYETNFLRSAEPQYELQDYIQQAEKLTRRKLSPAETSAFWFRQGLGYLTAHPLPALKLYCQKFFYTCNNLEAPNNVSFYAAKELSPLLKFLPWGFALLLAGGTAGLFAQRKNPKIILILLLLSSVLAANLLFFTSSEFRFPAVTALLLGGGIFLRKIFYWWKERKVEWGLLAIFLAILLFSYFQTDLGQSLKSPKMDFYNFGSVCLAQKDYLSAEKYLLRSLKYDPFYPQTHLALGTLYLDTAQYKKAAVEFQAAGYNVSPQELEEGKPLYLP